MQTQDPTPKPSQMPTPTLANQHNPFPTVFTVDGVTIVTPKPSAKCHLKGTCGTPWPTVSFKPTRKNQKADSISNSALGGDDEIKSEYDDDAAILEAQKEKEKKDEKEAKKEKDKKEKETKKTTEEETEWTDDGDDQGDTDRR